MVLCDFNYKVEGDDDDDDDEVVDEQGRRNGTEGQRACVAQLGCGPLLMQRNRGETSGSNKAWS